MPLRYLLDEQLRGGGLWQAILRHNSRGVNPLDVIRVGDPPAPPGGSLDPEILRWAEQEGRILVSADKKTLPGHLKQHLLAGRHSPGVFLIRPASAIPRVLFALELAAYAGDPLTFQDRAEYIP